MFRESVYPYKEKDPPGATVHMLREQKYGISLRQLAEKCEPPLDHSTIRRLEINEGFTHDSIRRVAKALGVKKQLLFYPPKIVEVLANLPLSHQERVLAMTEQEVVDITKKAIERHYSDNRGRRK